MKYVLFAVTIILIALSSEAQAPTGITVNTQGPHHNLRFIGDSHIMVNCSEDPKEDRTTCSFSLLDDHGQFLQTFQKAVGVPAYTQK